MPGQAPSLGLARMGGLCGQVVGSPLLLPPGDGSKGKRRPHHGGSQSDGIGRMGFHPFHTGCSTSTDTPAGIIARPGAGAPRCTYALLFCPATHSCSSAFEHDFSNANSC